MNATQVELRHPWLLVVTVLGLVAVGYELATEPSLLLLGGGSLALAGGVLAAFGLARRSAVHAVAAAASVLVAALALEYGEPLVAAVAAAGVVLNGVLVAYFR